MQVHHIPMTADLEEITQHGSGGFPVAVYTTVVKDNVYGYIPLHWHTELQFVVVLEGRVKFTVDHDELIIGAGEGIFINSGWLHSARTCNNEDSSYICIDFLPEFIAPRDSRIYSNSIFPVMSDQTFKVVKLAPEVLWQNKVLNIILELQDAYYVKKSNYELKTKCSICSIWSELVENLDTSESLSVHMEPETSRRIKDMLEYIHNHYGSGIRLSDLADVSNLSRSECCRTFKRSVRATPFEYLKRYRIAQSMKLLMNPDKSITEVALEVGFNSNSYFISSFRKITGMTPSQYRKSKDSLKRLNSEFIP